MYPIKDDQQFVADFLKEEKVLLVQGSGFNWVKSDHFRVVFLPHEDVLTEAIARLARFLERYRQKHSRTAANSTATKAS
jgi:alanine-synthesizing transaminase